MITSGEANKVLRYEPNTGNLYWRVHPMNQVNIGDRAGSFHKATGYVRIMINGNMYQAHRVIWLMVYGYWPKQTDHINHVKSDNRLENLREVNNQVNQRNQTTPRNNTSGVLGVRLIKKSSRWAALITVNRKQMYLGSYIDWFDAVCARKSAEHKHNFHPNHGKAHG